MKEYTIYKCYDNKTKMVYIGQTCNFKKRVRQHYNEKKRLTHFHKALKKRPQDFEWSIIEEHLTLKQANEREMYWIKYHNSFENGFNETLGGDGTKGLSGEKNHFYGKHHTEESKKKIGQRDYSHMHTNNPGKMGGWNKGISPSKETKEKMSISAKNRIKRIGNPMYNIVKSEETGWVLKEKILLNGKVVKRWYKKR